MGQVSEQSDRPKGPGNTHNIINRENASPALELASPPILVATVNDLDDITLVKRQFARFGCLKGMQGSNAGNDAQTGIHRG
jgi:hypothetical protein